MHHVPAEAASCTHEHRSVCPAAAARCSNHLPYILNFISMPAHSSALESEPIQIVLNGVPSGRLNEDSDGHIVGSSLWSGGALIERNESRRVPPGSGSVDRDEVDGLLWFAVICFKTALIESRSPQTAACIGVTLLTHKLREHRPELPSPLLLMLSDKDDDVWDLDWCLNWLFAISP